MEIVIKIDDKDKETALLYLKDSAENIRDFCQESKHYSDSDKKDLESLECIIKALENGTPLPKGHGRLIEEPTETDISNTVGGNNDFAECIRDSVKAVFENAKIIVEADKG